MKYSGQLLFLFGPSGPNMEIAARQRGDLQLRLRLLRCQRLRPRLALRLRPQCQPRPKLLASQQPKPQLQVTPLDLCEVKKPLRVPGAPQFLESRRE